MIELIFIGIIAACFTHFLNYIIGKPGSKEFSPYEIFSSYTVWLSKKRLEQIDLYKTYANQYNDGIKRTNSRSEVLTMQNDFKKMIYEAAEPYFTWERAAGMCPVCTGFWISLITGILYFLLSYHSATFGEIIVDLLIVIVISHITTRLLSKII